MTKQYVEDEYYRYDRNGVSLLLPKALKVIHDAPQLDAVAKTGYGDIVLLINPEKGVQDAWEEMLARPQGTIPELHTTVVRERELSHPYKGLERVIEHRVVDRPDLPANFGWLALFYPPESFLMVQIGGDGTFASNEAIWQKVIDSIRVKEV